MENLDGQTRHYMIEELGMPLPHIENTLEVLKKHPDIYQEFGTWLEKRTYAEAGLQVEGYSASRIASIQPRLSGLAVYLLLANLRDEPAKTLSYLKEGLVIR